MQLNGSMAFVLGKLEPENPVTVGNVPQPTKTAVRDSKHSRRRIFMAGSHGNLNPWYCQAIRGNYPFLGISNDDRQKHLRQKNDAVGICASLCQTTIFLRLDFFAFLVAAEGRNQRTE